MMKYWKPALALLVVAFALQRMLAGGAIARAPGELAADDPLQSLVNGAASIDVGEFKLTPRAEYRIEARVLRTERYNFGTEAELSPIDFAMGWGVMSNSDTLKHFRVTQSARFFTLYPDEQAIDIKDALLHSANMHLIPSSDRIRRTLLKTRPGHIARLEGYLVNVTRSDGFYWNSSLTREDTGAGACELMYVTTAELR
jgi:hypothetical protein